MRVIVLGADGYLGWPTAMRFAAQGHEVLAVDNYLRREIAFKTDSEPLFATPDLKKRTALFKAETGRDIEVRIGDLSDFRVTEALFREFKPDVAVHYAEQPSAPYSMKGFEEARETFQNNLGTTFNVIWAVIENCPDCHIVKLGTMGEYGTPEIDIEEGWITIEHKGRSDKFLYPRQAGSLYHTTKVLDTDLLWFYVRMAGLRVTDLMQGPVYGLVTPECEGHADLRPNFHYDDIFGTVVNRFLAQAAAGIPLTVYGQGGQTRGYLDLRDTLQCIELSAGDPAGQGELRIFNQFVEQFSVNQLAEKVSEAGGALGVDVEVKSIPNPRKEKEDHYYNAAHTGLLELGLQPHYLTQEVLTGMLEQVLAEKDRIDQAKVFPRVSWNR